MEPVTVRVCNQAQHSDKLRAPLRVCFVDSTLEISHSAAGNQQDDSA
jgi:hypothetical protein